MASPEKWWWGGGTDPIIGRRKNQQKGAAERTNPAKVSEKDQSMCLQRRQGVYILLLPLILVYFTLCQIYVEQICSDQNT